MNEKIFAYHFDLKRPMWQRAYMVATVDRLKAWDFNTVLYEIEDKLRFTKHPMIAHDDAWSPQETRDFVQWCRAKEIRVIPFMQALGHSECVVGKPEYAHLREVPEVHDQYDPLSEEARQVIIELYDEIIDVFQPEYLHMGGDETWSLGSSPQGQEYMRQRGVGALYLQHMQPLFAHIIARGVRPLLWADIVLTHPEVLPQLPREVVLVDWDYWTNDARPKDFRYWGRHATSGAMNTMVTWEEYSDAVSPEFKQHLEQFLVDEQTLRDGTFRPFYTTDALCAQRLDVITASANRCGGDMMTVPDPARHLANCFLSAHKGKREAFGNLVTSWAIRRAHPEVCHFATFAAAYANDNTDSYDAEILGRAFTADFYGFEESAFAEAAILASGRFALAGDWGMEAMNEKWQRGQDPLPEFIETNSQSFGGREKYLAHLCKLHDDYQQARNIFIALQSQATRNARNLDFWIDAVDLQLFGVDFVRAAIDGVLEQRAPQLLDRLTTLTHRTRQLFGIIYAPQSTEDEIEFRSGFYRKYLYQCV
jgi:hypothetical protein